VNVRAPEQIGNLECARDAFAKLRLASWIICDAPLLSSGITPWQVELHYLQAIAR
jgi:hypothetical protein